MVDTRRANAEMFQSLFAGDERFIMQREHGAAARGSRSRSSSIPG